jgi:AcrR family transcriptional regulator
MSRTPNSRKEETHERIVDAAARAIQRHGYAGVGVADVMKEAGLTHGGFYAHFDSREALLVEALERAGRKSFAAARAAELRARKGVSAFRLLVESYLADHHLASLETGCPIAALGCDMPRQSEIVREASAVCVQRLIAAVRSTLLPRVPRATASVVAGTLVGSLQLARALGDNAEGRAVLSAARKSLIQQHDRPGAVPR